MKWISRAMPISLVLAFGFSLLLIASHAVDLVIVVTTVRGMIQSVASDRVDKRLDLLEAKVEALVRPVEAQVEHIRASFARGALGQGRGEPALTRAFLSGALAATPQLVGLAFIHADARVELHGRAAPFHLIEDWSGRPGVAQALQWSHTVNRANWAPPIQSEFDPQSVVITRPGPLETPSGRIGLIVAAVSVDSLSRFLAQEAETGGTSFILWGEEHVLAHPVLVDPWPGLTAAQPLPRLDQIADPVVAAFARRQPIAEAKADARDEAGTVTVAGIGWTILYRRFSLDEHTLILGTYLPGSLVEAEQNAMLGALMIGLASFLGAIALAVVFGRVIGRPLLELGNAAAQLESGALETVPSLPRSRIREVDRAASAFNAMVSGLRERQTMRDLFSRYVPAQVAQDLIESGSGVSTLLRGSRRREVSLMFTDIAGFTTLTEKRPAELVVPMLNGYLDQVCRIIAEHRGIVVDFLGDAVFAVFGAPVEDPDHARQALGAALEIDSFGYRYSQEATANGVPFGHTRIGVNAGPAMVGTFGARDRLKYGAMGDAVNVAARLEAVNRIFGTRVLTTRAMLAQVSQIQGRIVAEVAVLGREETLEVVEPLRARPRRWLADYEAAYALLGVDGMAALDAFSDLAARRPKDPVIAFHLERLRSGTSSRMVTMVSK